MLPYPSKDIAFYYALRWLAKHSGRRQTIEYSQLTAIEVTFCRCNTSQPKATVWIDDTIYVWGDYLIVCSPGEWHGDAAGHLTILHSSGVTKTYFWGNKP